MSRDWEDGGQGDGVRPSVLRLVGYWSGVGAEGWPDPRALVDGAWDRDEREFVAGYLRTGLICRSYMGLSPCRMCGQKNGALELTDGVWVWPEGLAHYVDDHAVRLPVEFVEHAFAHTVRLEQADRETDWWRSRA